MQFVVVAGAAGCVQGGRRSTTYRMAPSISAVHAVHSLSARRPLAVCIAEKAEYNVAPTSDPHGFFRNVHSGAGSGRSRLRRKRTIPGGPVPRTFELYDLVLTDLDPFGATRKTMNHVPLLILLVGSNPLPNYLAARAICPSSIRLVYTPETEQPMKHLKEALKRYVRAWEDPRCVASSDPPQIQAAVRNFPADTQLNYTGGTKVMAAHARLAFRDAGGSDDRASYVDERAGVLRFDNGIECPLVDESGPPSLETVLYLHGITLDNQPRQAAGSPDEGELLERQLGQWIHEMVPTAQLQQGLYCRLHNGRQFEIDVCFIRGHRLYLVSCTITRHMDKCKSRLFEVATRARQLGGDLARSSLVCRLEGSNDRGPFVDQLRQDIESVWDSPNIPGVFGAADLAEWEGAHGKPDRRTLREWLDS